MKYSVWSHNRKQYDVYEDGRTDGTHAGAPSVVASGKIGVTPEAGTWRLPLTATKIGVSDLPKGRIASRGGIAIGDVDFADPKTLIVAAGIGYVAYLAWRRFR